MTPKQRAKIYRKAAERIERGYTLFCCNAIKLVDPLLRITENNFPELFLFEPNDKEKEISGTNGYSAWWPYHFVIGTEASKRMRILALLLCEQIALNP